MDVVRMTLLGVSVFAGVGAYMLFSNPAEPAREQSAQGPTQPAVEMEDILVAAGDLPAGRALNEGDYIWQQWPANTIQPSMIRRKVAGDINAELRGAYVRVPMSAGEPVRRDKYLRAGRGSGYLAATLATGLRAVAVPIDGQGLGAAGGFILPNDRVDVVRVGRDEDARATEMSVQTLLTNIRVLAVGQNVSERISERTSIGPTATLEVTPEQAEMLLLAQRTGQLSLVLRSLADNALSTAQDTPRESTLSVVRYGVSQGVR